jgi:tRNA pseudouridine-54 N-methylase
MNKKSKPPPDPKKEKTIPYNGLLRDQAHITLYIGRKNSGKTNLLVSMLLDKRGYRDIYSKIIIVSPTFESQRSTWGRISGEGIVVYKEFSESVLEKIYSDQQNNKSRALLIMDDNGEDLKKIKPSTFNKLVSNSRHLGGGLSIIALLQKTTQSPTILRANCDSFVCFSATSVREQEILYQEIGVLDKATFTRIFRDATREQYSCLVISIISGKIKFFKKFHDEYIVSNK